MAAGLSELGQYTQLSPEALASLFGTDWEKARLPKVCQRLDLGGARFNLERLETYGDDGIFHPRLNRSRIEVLNVSRNQLVDISCLSRFQDGRPEFLRLNILNASHNQIMKVSLTPPMLTEVNLGYNELVELPDVSRLADLHKLILCHNRIDDSLDRLVHNKKLRYLDISSNRLSWRPSSFKKQVDILKQCHIEELSLRLNPFVEHFSEYQVLALSELPSLTHMDGAFMDRETMKELHLQAGKWRGKADYGAFDIKVEDRRLHGEPVEARGGSRSGEVVQLPCLAELSAALGHALDRPGEAALYVQDFQEQVRKVWEVRYWDREKLMEIRDKSGRPLDRQLDPAEEAQAVAMLASCLQQALARFDGSREALVSSLARLLAAGSGLLSQRCAEVLAEWFDSAAPGLQAKLPETSAALFRDLVCRVALGVQSAAELPHACFQASQGDIAKLRANVRMGAWADEESVAECAGILGALTRFGPQEVWAQETRPVRAQSLEVFVPVLCRGSRQSLGPDKPSGAWAKYEDMDAAPGGAEQTLELQAEDLDAARERCVRHGHGGFSTVEVQPGVVRASFWAREPEVLACTRRAAPGCALHVRPCVGSRARSVAAGVLRKRGEEHGDRHEAWAAWTHGMEVLKIATSDPKIAARCVDDFGLHAALAAHLDDGWPESWVLACADAARALVLSLQVLANLLRSSGDAGARAAQELAERKVHSTCWRRVQQRGGTVLVSALVGVVCGILARVDDGACAAIAGDLQEAGLDMFHDLLDAAVADPAPDPLLLSAGLEMACTLVGAPGARNLVLERVLRTLQDGEVLIAFVRGPVVNGQPNGRYQELWRQCEVLYPRGSERFPELLDGAQDQHRWRRRVPEVADVQHPLMHRVFLAIASFIELFSGKAHNDPAMHRVSALLDSAGREALLIGPGGGLVNCPSVDVKMRCLRCISRTLQASPEQCETEEMGWLVRFLSPGDVASGRHCEFLVDVLQLIAVLVRSQARVGHSFRRKFAKSAVREAFDLLRANARRDNGRTDDEDTTLRLNLKIVDLLSACSSQRSGELRQFLRRLDLLSGLKEVAELEEQRGGGCAAEVLRTWPGRSVREVLMPLACGGSAPPTGRIRFLALARLGDVLEGRLDRGPSAELGDDDDWPSLAAMQSELDRGDALDKADGREQQEHFAAGDGLCALLSLAERFCDASSASCHLQEARRTEERRAREAAERTRQWWDDAPGSVGCAPAHGVWEAGPSDLERRFILRLRAVSARVSALFSCNLNVFDEKLHSSSLSEVGRIMAIHFQENQRRSRAQLRAQPEAFRELLAMPNFYMARGELMSDNMVRQLGVEVDRARQPRVHLEVLQDMAHVAQRRLKHLVIAAGGGDRGALAWANAMADDTSAVGRPSHGARLGTGLADFLQRYAAQVVDPGVMPREEVEHRLKYKLEGDVTRLRSLSRLAISFPDAAALLASATELRTQGRLSVVRIRNQFATPSCLAWRGLVMNVEVEVDAGRRHICELQFSIRDPAPQQRGGVAHRKSALPAKLRRQLVEGCKVQEADAGEVVQLLMREIESRSLRHGDALMLRCGDAYLEAHGEELFVRQAQLNTGHLFRVDRELGIGIIRYGDVVSLRSRATGKYVELSSTGRALCSSAEPSGHGCFHFVVEPAGGADRHGPRSGAAIRLREQTSQRFLTLAPRPGMEDGARLMGQLQKSGSEQLQAQTIFREGSVADLLQLEGHRGDDPGASLAPAAATSEERAALVLLEAHMQSGAADAERVAAQRRRARDTERLFVAIARAQGAAPAQAPRRRGGEDVAAALLPQLVAGIVRCAHSLVALPRSEAAERYAFDALLFGGSKGGRPLLPQLFGLALCAARARPSPGCSAEDCFDPSATRLPAKLLRLLSAALAAAPPLCAPMGGPHGGGDEERDRQRVALLDVASSFVSEALLPSLQARLATTTHMPLSLSEVRVLRDFAVAAEALVFALFANELRRSEPPQPRDPGSPLALAGCSPEGMASAACRAECFATLLPKCVVGALVQALIYGMHHEALAYSAGDAAGAVPVRLLSSLVDRASVALGAAAFGHGGGDVDYELCEALARASAGGAALVPRARAAELMRGRGAERHRVRLQELLQEGARSAPAASAAVDAAATVVFGAVQELPPPAPVATEQVVAVAQAWLAEPDASPEEAGGGAAACVVAVTSQSNLFMLASGSPQAEGWEALPARAFRSLGDLHRVVTCRGMPQFLGLVWNDASTDLRREVLIFESSARRRGVHEALRRCRQRCPRRPRRRHAAEEACAASSPLPWRGIPATPLRQEVWDALAASCRKDRGFAGASIVDVTFVRAAGESAPGDSAEGLEVLVMTTESCAILSFRSFLGRYARRDDVDHYTSDAAPVARLEDSDSDDAGAGPRASERRTSADGAAKMEVLRGGPWPLHTLQGVWFLAEAESKVRLQFATMEEILFTSEGDRQRWRRRLRGVLGSATARGGAQDGSAWSIMPTDKVTIHEVRRAHEAQL